jgi:hypothetical protein
VTLSFGLIGDKNETMVDTSRPWSMLADNSGTMFDLSRPWSRWLIIADHGRSWFDGEPAKLGNQSKIATSNLNLNIIVLDHHTTTSNLSIYVLLFVNLRARTQPQTSCSNLKIYQNLDLRPQTSTLNCTKPHGPSCKLLFSTSLLELIFFNDK